MGQTTSSSSQSDACDKTSLEVDSASALVLSPKSSSSASSSSSSSSNLISNSNTNLSLSGSGSGSSSSSSSSSTLGSGLSVDPDTETLNISLPFSDHLSKDSDESESIMIDVATYKKDLALSPLPNDRDNHLINVDTYKKDLALSHPPNNRNNHLISVDAYPKNLDLCPLPNDRDDQLINVDAYKKDLGLSPLTNDRDFHISHVSSHNNEKEYKDHSQNVDESIESRSICEQEISPPNIEVIDLKLLSEDQLRDRLSEIDIDREDILSLNRIQKRNDNEYYARYLEDGPFDIFKDGDDRLSLAILLLQISPKLHSLRYNMVPARVSERKFWICVFCLLEKGRLDLKKESAFAEEYKAEKENDSSVVELLSLKTHTPQKENLEIKRLKEKLASTEQALEKMKIEMLSMVKVSSIEKSVPSIHSGKWIMDKDSEEFLALGDDIKQQLREGKRKKMNELMEQMKFILDDDDISSTHGRWACCGKTAYRADGCS